MEKVLIIAEAGVNHNGNLELAKKLVDVAKEAGADCVKFQTFQPAALVSRYAEKAEYQKVTTAEDESQLDMLKKLSLQYEDYVELAEYCKIKDIGFMSTPFDLESIVWLEKVGVDCWKIPSGEITNYPYLCRIAQTDKSIILSTGMSTLEEVKEAVALLQDNGAKNISLLHCTTEYPTPYEDVNLNAMLKLQDTFGLEVGYSDHTVGIETSVAAVALGASIIEKHFTLDKNMEGPDHKASLEPNELKALVKAIRNVEKIKGDGEKRPSSSEIKNIAIARKSIVAAMPVKKGELLTIENITTKRPGTGISPMKWEAVLGTVAIRDFEEDELIEI